MMCSGQCAKKARCKNEQLFEGQYVVSFGQKAARYLLLTPTQTTHWHIRALSEGVDPHLHPDPGRDPGRVWMQTLALVNWAASGVEIKSDYDVLTSFNRLNTKKVHVWVMKTCGNVVISLAVIGCSCVVDPWGARCRRVCSQMNVRLLSVTVQFSAQNPPSFKKLSRAQQALGRMLWQFLFNQC